jgi:hypothetical protein
MKKENARTQLVTAADLIPPFHVGLAKQVRRISMHGVPEIVEKSLVGLI